MGFQQWQFKSAIAEVAQAEPASVEPDIVAPAKVEQIQPTPVSGSVVNVVSKAVDAFPVDASHLNWDELARVVSGCQACDLYRQRTQAVLGVGNREADWLIIGEAPGEQEDIQGEPFVGRAGRLLDNMLLAMGLDRKAVYIANVVKCRPPRNRDPRPEEVAACLGYLQRQIALIQPKIILVVGRIAAQNLLKTEDPVGRLRGKLHRLPGTDIPLVVSYHPAYLLRKPVEKAKAWEDLKLALSVMSP
jgi:DNA polymerase